MEYTIEQVGEPKRISRYPFNEMQAGDSFLVKGDARIVKAAVGSAYRRNRVNGDSLTRLVTRKEKGGVRVYMVKAGV
ncbi:MAG TPA: hypothetical protein VN638_06365 [Nitrospiraceae bacterium]|nr:hypothetical protein [Nitrospiraceae bacterium]